jgi:hypothetical protein
VTLPVPAHVDLMGHRKFIVLNDIGQIALSFGSPVDIAAELQARTRDGSEWDRQEEVFRAAVGAYAAAEGRQPPGPRRSGAPVHIFFDPGRDTQSYQAVRDG